MTDLSQIEQRLQKIEQRNKRVEIDKAWETSWMRKFFISLFTYLSIGFYFNMLGVAQPWLNSIVPAFGFLLSTLTLPYIKKIWAMYYSLNK
jgi:hypothetical protein